MDPGQARFDQHTKELSPREVAAEERKRKAITGGAEVLYHSSGDSVNRDEEVIMLEIGCFMLQWKVSERTIMTTPLNSEFYHSSKNSEYDQEIPQSQTADNPVRKSRSTIPRHQEDKLSRAISSLFPINTVNILLILKF